jgi:hypothetical protein
MGKASAPQAPDYASAAKETAAGNKEAAQFAVNANRINQVTPYGSLTYSRAQPAFDQAGYDKAMAAYNAGGATQTQQAPAPQTYFDHVTGTFQEIPGSSGSTVENSRTAPRREDFMAPDDGGGWTQTMNLTDRKSVV